MTQKKSKMVKNIPARGEIAEKEMIPLLFCFKDKKSGEKKAYAALKIADSEEERRVGLSKTESLGPASGMFFTKSGSFWMPPEMKFPLDIIFIDRKGTILEKKAMPMDCGRGRYTSYEPYVVHAVELPLGFCNKHHIGVGDSLEVDVQMNKSAANKSKNPAPIKKQVVKKEPPPDFSWVPENYTPILFTGSSPSKQFGNGLVLGKDLIVYPSGRDASRLRANKDYVAIRNDQIFNPKWVVGAGYTMPKNTPPKQPTKHIPVPPGKQEFPEARNNPLGVTRTRKPWFGEIVSTGKFSDFNSATNGLRAGIKNLMNINTRSFGGKGTPKQLLPVHAPKVENDIDSYISNVESWSGIPSTNSMSNADTAAWVDLIRAMVRREHGIPAMNWFTPEEYTNAVNSARLDL